MKKSLLIPIIFTIGIFFSSNFAAADTADTTIDAPTDATLSATPSSDTVESGSQSSTDAASQTTGPSNVSSEQVDIDIPTGFFENFSILFNGLLRFVIIIAALLTFVYLIWGSIDWITSGGDRGKTEAARSKLTSALIGLIVVAASYAILTIVLNFLGYQSLEDVLNRVPGM